MSAAYCKLESRKGDAREQPCSEWHDLFTQNFLKEVILIDIHSLLMRTTNRGNRKKGKEKKKKGGWDWGGKLSTNACVEFETC